MINGQADEALELTNLRRIGRSSIERLREDFRAASDDLLVYQELSKRLIAAGVTLHPCTEGLEPVLTHRKTLAEGLLKSQEALMQSAQLSILKRLCPDCYGDGERYIGSPIDSTLQDCPTCKGSGLRPA